MAEIKYLIGSSLKGKPKGYAYGLWNPNTATLTTFFTSSTQNTASQEYYYEIWGSASLSCNDEKMFSVAYGHVSGSGSLNVGGDLDDTPSRAIYSQYKLLCLDGDEGNFYLSGSTAPITHFYAININRSKFGDKLDPGNFEFSLAELSGSGKANNVHTGSNVQVKTGGTVITLIDDSGDANDTNEDAVDTSVSRNLVSGSLTNGIYNSSAPHVYGKVYPSQGIILIDADKLNLSSSFNTVTGSNINGQNPLKLFTAISGGYTNHSSGFTARGVQTKNELFYFIRVNNASANYSNNPTFVKQDLISKGEIKNAKWKNDPKVYITSIGLYGPDETGNSVLLAIAKLSKPIQKSFNSELSITVKLEY